VEVKPKAEIKPEVKIKPKAKAKPKAEAKPEAKAKPKKEAKPQVEAAVRPQPKVRKPLRKIDIEELEELDEIEKEKIIGVKAPRVKARPKPEKPKEEVHEEAAPKEPKKIRVKVLREPTHITLPSEEEKSAAPVAVEEPEPRFLEFDQLPEVRSLAKRMKVKARHLIKRLAELGMDLTEKDKLDPDTAEIIAHEYEYEIKINVQRPVRTEAEEEKLAPRPPVVTFMGHVDHGKTTLMDYIRKSSVVQGEAGGITQHIGAYKVKVHDHEIVFLDTPGHEAFTSMRARGAKVTDICVLVIAADDGVMPQTVEAINHAQAAEAQTIIAINKIDRPSASVERVKQQLMQRGLAPEDWGGDIICVPVSAITGEGVEDLLEMLVLQAEVLELKANPDKPGRGVIIESSLTPGRGAVATALVQEGTLKVGDIMLADQYYGRVKAMIDENGNRLAEAGPSTPVAVLGLNGVPTAGVEFSVIKTERLAREIAESRIEENRIQAQAAIVPTSLEDFLSMVPEAEKKQLKVIMKADVQGSLEALKGSIEKIPSDKIELNIIHSGVGDIAESDVMLASASDAAIIGFQVKYDAQVEELARKEGVQMFLYDVIYRAIDDIRRVLEESLEPVLQERITGKAAVKQLFSSSALGTIAGCYVTEGTIVRGGKVRVFRDEELVHQGELASLKYYQEEPKEVRAGQECGIKIKGYNEVQVDDVLEVFVIDKIPQKL